MTQRRSRPYLPRIALLFDFDSTLADHSIPNIAEALGVGEDEWKTRFVEPLDGGWDEIPLHAQAFIDAGRATGRTMSRDVLLEAAERTTLFPGVTEMPERLRAAARAIDPDLELEFSVLSSGFHELIAATPIAEAFDRIYASGYHFSSDGRALCIKRAVTHAGKALYLEAYGKGLLEENEPADAHMKAARPVPEEERRVPFDQMIYCGDGESDLQAFAFLEAQGGHAIAIAGGGGFEPDGQTEGERVKAVLPPDYAPDGEDHARSQARGRSGRPQGGRRERLVERFTLRLTARRPGVARRLCAAPARAEGQSPTARAQPGS